MPLALRTKRSTSTGLASLVVGVLAAVGCAETDETWQVPMVEYALFKDDVYPVLLRDCGFHGCHGSGDRYFRVWGPGRVRLAVKGQRDESSAFDPVTDLEINSSYQSAIGFVDARDARRSLLLRKPLATEAGGAGHLGVDKYGRNVYRTPDSPGYLELSKWVFSVMPP
ncbi:MAG: hypothetical protein RL701_5746 [Pseudomonadota bacterium]|jgi:hypothetical protein